VGVVGIGIGIGDIQGMGSSPGDDIQPREEQHVANPPPRTIRIRPLAHALVFIYLLLLFLRIITIIIFWHKAGDCVKSLSLLLLWFYEWLLAGQIAGICGSFAV